MRGTLIYFNGLLALVFVAFFIYTLFARDHIENAAHEYVVSETLEHALPHIATAEQLLTNKFVRVVLTAEQETVIRNELARFRYQPRAYLDELTARGRTKVAAEDGIPEKFTAWKKPVIEYYERMLARVLWHVRVFAVTNVIAAVIACWAAYLSRLKIYAEQLVISAVLFIAVLFCSVQFFDEMTYFKIITNTASSTSYPLSLIAMFAWLYSDLAPALRKVTEIDSSIECGR